MQQLLREDMLMRAATVSYLGPFLLKELGVYLLADDLGANIIFDSDAEPHLFQDKLHLLLLFHGAVRLHLSNKKQPVNETGLSSSHITCA